MRKTFGAIGAALAIVVAMATSTAPAVASFLDGSVSADGEVAAAGALDTAGFPTGRRLADDVTDIELRVIS